MDVSLTHNERLDAYQRQNKLVIEELQFIFIDEIRPEHCAVHRLCFDKIKQLCPDRDRLLKAVAKAVISAAIDKGIENV